MRFCLEKHEPASLQRTGDHRNPKFCIVALGKIAQVTPCLAHQTTGACRELMWARSKLRNCFSHRLHHRMLVEHPQPVLVAYVGHWFVEDALYDLAACGVTLAKDFGAHRVVLVQHAHCAAVPEDGQWQWRQGCRLPAQDSIELSHVCRAALRSSLNLARGSQLRH